MKVRCTVLLAALVGAAGCKPRATAPDKAMPPAPSAETVPPPAGAAKSIDDQIAEALKDVDPILIYKRVPVPDAENAWPLWAEAIGKLVEIEDNELERAFDAACGLEPEGLSEEGNWRLRGWMADNRNALGLFEEGLRRGRCQLPEVTSPDAEFPHLAPLRQLARVLLVRGVLASVDGNPSAAARGFCAVVRFGSLLARGDGVLIEYLVALAISDLGVRGARWLAGTDVPQEVLKQSIEKLRPQPRPGSDLAATVRVEFAANVVPYLCDVLSEAARETEAGEAKAPLAHQELSIVISGFVGPAAKYHVRAMRNALGPWPARNRHIEEDLKRHLDQLDKVMAGAIQVAGDAGMEGRSVSEKEVSSLTEPLQESGPRMMIAMFVGGLKGSVERSFRLRADRAATRTVLALRLYEMRKGRLPDSLQALVAEKILEGVPIDPFSDGPLRYSKKRRVVWSVGPDETDDGGRLEGKDPGSWRGKDYVLRVPGGR